jgi:hypothetical protein
MGRMVVTRSLGCFDLFDFSSILLSVFALSTLERRRNLVTTFVALILYSASA